MKFITGLSQYEPHGPITIDFVHLWDGRVLGINNECVVLYKNMEDFDTMQAKYRAYMRFSAGWSDYRGIVGSKGTNLA